MAKVIFFIIFLIILLSLFKQFFRYFFKSKLMSSTSLFRGQMTNFGRIRNRLKRINDNFFFKENLMYFFFKFFWRVRNIFHLFSSTRFLRVRNIFTYFLPPFSNAVRIYLFYSFIFFKIFFDASKILFSFIFFNLFLTRPKFSSLIFFEIFFWRVRNFSHLLSSKLFLTHPKFFSKGVSF